MFNAHSINAPKALLHALIALSINVPFSAVVAQIPPAMNYSGCLQVDLFGPVHEIDIPNFIDTNYGCYELRLDGNPVKLEKGWSLEQAIADLESNNWARQSLYLIDVFSRELINLTTEPGNYGELSWSPDGQQLAFVSGNFNEQHLYTIQPDGQDLTKLTSQSFSSIYLNWSRDSQRIVFTGYSEDGEDKQYVVNRGGSALIDLTQDAASDGSPNW